MKRIVYIITVISLLIGCNKENIIEESEDDTNVTDQKQDLLESNIAFMNANYTFDSTGDTLKDQLIGLWLSNSVTYTHIICDDCTNLFTWAIESTGDIIKRNNSWGENNTGTWEIDSTKNFILFSYKDYLTFTYDNGLKSGDYRIQTDSIKIEELSKTNLWVSHPTGKHRMDIKFSKIKQ